MALLTELGAELISDKAAVRIHGARDARKDPPTDGFFDHGKWNAREDVIAAGMSEFVQGLADMQGVGFQDSDTAVVPELVTEVRDECRIHLEQYDAAVRAHALDDFARVTTFAGAEFDNDPRTGEIKARGSLAGEKRRAGNQIADPQGIREDAFKKQEAHGTRLRISWAPACS